MSFFDLVASYSMAFIGLLFIVNPLNGAVLFLKLTEGLSEDRKKKTAKSAAVATLLILLIFSLTGKVIFEVFGFTLAAFQIAGGFIIFSSARGMTQARTPREKNTPEEMAHAQELEDVSIVPLAIPILAGPGAITAVILHMGAMNRFVVEFPIHFVSLSLVSLITYISLYHSNKLFHKLGHNVINVLTRIMGIVMMALGVQYILNGIARYIQQLNL